MGKAFEVTDEVPAGRLSHEPAGQLRPGRESGRPLVPDGGGQLDNGRRPQATVQMVVQQDLRGAADLLQAGSRILKSVDATCGRGQSCPRSDGARAVGGTEAGADERRADSGPGGQVPAAMRAGRHESRPGTARADERPGGTGPGRMRAGRMRGRPDESRPDEQLSGRATDAAGRMRAGRTGAGGQRRLAATQQVTAVLLPQIGAARSRPNRGRAVPCGVRGTSCAHQPIRSRTSEAGPAGGASGTISSRPE